MMYITSRRHGGARTIRSDNNSSSATLVLASAGSDEERVGQPQARLPCSKQGERALHLESILSLPSSRSSWALFLYRGGRGGSCCTHLLWSGGSCLRTLLDPSHHCALSHYTSDIQRSRRISTATHKAGDRCRDIE